ncbi:protein of unknown function (plasmid) [Rhodovastum atsumiense]|uniref:hypothetical protein n=1 Tax=Rhodovastum atsumiense TaxID=504468 RepID=UPI0020254C9B|nr:hypothetical protein [Rhodovastum atsumiense]CAH2605606.1 protein of unknown function [Rhodovastum atsumiense]
MLPEAPQPTANLPALPNTYYVSQDITLTRQEVIAALSAAVLARAGELARFGAPRLRSLALDAKISIHGADIAAVIATVEAPLEPSLVAALAALPTAKEQVRDAA